MAPIPSTRPTLEAASQEVRAGRQTCAGLLEACLAQIDASEADVRAWVIVDREGARAQALDRDAELAAGRWRGPLHGIPLGIKDIVDVAGLPTAAGSKRWGKTPAADDAPVVALLREAGAVIVGKTVTTPYAWIDPPPTANPHDLRRTPGGSSSGSAAAVACGMCLGAIGSQTGGSIIRPASFCGVAGLKPTHGRLSLAGILPLAPSLDHPGPIASTVRDLALMWAALAPTDRASRVEAPPRLGRLRGLFHDRAEPVMREAIDRALATLAASGARVEETPLPESFGDVLAQHRRVMAAEVAAWHERRFGEHPDDYPPRITELIEEGLALSATEYVRARQHQERLRRDILSCFDRVDVLVTPATLGPAPDRSTTGDAAFNSPWSDTGLPTVSFPIGRTPEGLPLAIQLVGKPGEEAGLLAAGEWAQEWGIGDRG